MSSNTWSGRAVTQARTLMSKRLPTPCGKCGKIVQPNDKWNVGHIKSRASYPQLTMDQNNWQIEHRECSDKSSQSAVQEKAARDALIKAGINPDEVMNSNNDFVFPSDGTARTSPPLPFSLSNDLASSDIPDWLSWDAESLNQFVWLQPLTKFPDNAAPPLAMTPPHAEAVGSYGEQAIKWIQQTQKIRLRWWQKLAITRQLEHRADGSLCWRTVVESCPRRAGKSVRIRGMALWRLAHAELIGEVQTVVHCGNDLPICREIQRGAWRWAEAEGWTVTRANGKEAIENPDGSRWLVRSQDGVYGWDAGLAVVDEGWDVKPDTVSEGLEPAMLEREWAQLHLTSTAHRRATSLMKQRISDALSTDDGETLLMLWAAPPGADLGDVATWKAASPHWSEDRRKMIAGKYEKALIGEVDPDADDPDPMEGFAAQYLNIWRLRAKRREVGDALVTEATWEALRADLSASQPDSVAVEGWTDSGVSVARAWRTGDTVTVTAEDFPDVASAAAQVKLWTLKSAVAVGTSLATDPAWQGMRIKPTSGPTRTAVADLARLLTDGVLRHAESDHLTAQVLALRTSPSPDGLRLRSTTRADAVKAAVWAATAARQKSVGKPRIIYA